MSLISELYNKISDYLALTFGPNFIMFTLLLTTAVSIVYLFALNYTIARLDKTYFLTRDLPSKARKDPSSMLDYLVHSLKIILGMCLLICGLLMLVLPGQGIITILLGLSLLPFPGKHKLEKDLLARKSVRSTLNWLRKKANKEPFVF